MADYEPSGPEYDVWAEPRDEGFIVIVKPPLPKAVAVECVDENIHFDDYKITKDLTELFLRPGMRRIADARIQAENVSLRMLAHSLNVPRPKGS